MKEFVGVFSKDRSSRTESKKIGIVALGFNVFGRDNPDEDAFVDDPSTLRSLLPFDFDFPPTDEDEEDLLREPSDPFDLLDLDSCGYSLE